MKQLSSVLILMLLLALMGSSMFGESAYMPAQVSDPNIVNATAAEETAPAESFTPVVLPLSALDPVESETMDPVSLETPQPPAEAVSATSSPAAVTTTPPQPAAVTIPRSPVPAIPARPAGVEPGPVPQPPKPRGTAPTNQGKPPVAAVVPELPRNLPEAKAIAVRDGESISSRNSILSYYGHPNSKRMGILGEYSMEELTLHMKKLAAEYDYLNGEKGVVLAFHLIYGTVWKGGDIGFLNREKLQTWINFAEKNGILVFIDHQLGKYDVRTAMKTMLPFLSSRNVHLAIDPEWHTLEPGTKLGNITGEDVNIAQEMMDTYLKENGIPGKKMLVVHQFNYTMIKARETVRANFPRVDLILNADGFGNPNQKYGSYNYNREAANIPLKGFKLFFPTTLRDWGWDSPLMKPAEVLKLNPQPVLIMYQ